MTQIAQGGAAVSVPMTTVGPKAGTSTPAIETWAVYNPSNVLQASGSNPGSPGGTVSASGYSVTWTGSTVTLGSNTYRILSLAVPGSASVGTNWALQQGTGGGSAYAPFDVIAAPAYADASAARAAFSARSVESVSIADTSRGRALILAGGVAFLSTSRSAPYYQFTASASAAAPLPAAGPWAQGPLLSDGDVSTGYTAPTGYAPAGKSYYAFALCGPGTTVGVAAAQVTFKHLQASACNYTARVYTSADGAAWTLRGTATGQTNTGANTALNIALDGGPGTGLYYAAYYQFVVSYAGYIPPRVSEVSLTGAGGAPVPSTMLYYAPTGAAGAALSTTGGRLAGTFALHGAASPIFATVAPNTTRTLGTSGATSALFAYSAGRQPGSWARGAVSALFATSGARAAVTPGAGRVPVGAASSLFANSGGRAGAALFRRGGTSALFSTLAGRPGAARAAVGAASALFATSAFASAVLAAAPASAVDNRDPFAVMFSALAALLALKGSPVSNASVLLAITDALAASYRTAEINLTANRLASLPELIRGGDGTPGHTTYGFGSDQPILTLLQPAEGMIAAAAPDVIQKGVYSGFVSAIQSLCSKLGYTSFDAYATAQNAGTRFSYLVHPNYALLSFLYYNKLAGTLLSPSNVFAPLTALGTIAVGPGAGATVFTPGASVPTANAGVQQGYTPAPGLAAVVTGTVNGTLNLTVTASGVDSGGVARTGRTWTGSVSNLSAGAAAVALTPGVAGDRISSVQSVTATGTATAGAVTLQTVLERIVS